MSKGKTTTTQEATLPDWQKDLYMDYYQRAKEASDIPFAGYTGDRFVGMSPEEMQMGAGIQGLFGSAFGYDPTGQLQALAGQAAPQMGDVQSLLDVDIGAYQSPYQQQVIDLAMQDIQEQSEMAQQRAQEAAIGAGAFGGSRSALLETEATKPYAQAAAETAAGLRQAGYQRALGAAESDIARQQQRALFAPEMELRSRQQQAGLLSGLLGGQQQALGLLGGYGALSRGLGQQEQDFAFQEFMREQGYPAYSLGLLGQGLGMMPQLVGQTSTVQEQAGPMGVLGGLAGLGSSLALGGINPFSGLSGLFNGGGVQTFANGSVIPPMQNFNFSPGGMVGSGYQSGQVNLPTNLPGLL
jgi:hypothetical protein